MRLAIAIAALLTPLSVEGQTFRFAGRAAAGEVQVAPDREYREGYGFEPGDSRRFSVALPEGNYRVTVVLGDAKAASDTTIKAEARRLMLRDVRTKRGKFDTRSFIVNTRTADLPPPPENAPGGARVRLNAREAGSPTWDEKLTIEMVGPAPHVASLRIEPVTAPTIFLFGDSTVTDQRCERGASWGQMLPRFLTSDIAVANHAESGETMKSFLTGLRLDKALSFMKPGDFALIQFGHNDQKANWPQTHAAAATTYRSYLRTYIAEVRRLGATPILVTSPERRNFNADGSIRHTLADYAEAARIVAKEEGVTLVDLNAASARFYQALGPTLAPLAFGNDGKDGTHHNNYGAYMLARIVIEGIRAAGSPLAARIAPDLEPFDIMHPILPADFKIAPSFTCASNPRPAGN
ncbi:rhamnogalacturonan acetylesterase [Sphingomonas sp.]|jgi:lysophospholipase L1-like esterase|uniref:rhamnogalacturonan acetylesterase n=1 Tax=Sphingomonas sp. TaxID=28214 RepID=UPI002ED7B652